MGLGAPFSLPRREPDRIKVAREMPHPTPSLFFKPPPHPAPSRVCGGGKGCGGVPQTPGPCRLPPLRFSGSGMGVGVKKLQQEI